jgi:4-alpha-glucanotransferase
VAELAVLPVQDLLGLDGAARMNTPGTLRGNWTWRLAPGELVDSAAERLRGLLALYGRL